MAAKNKASEDLFKNLKLQREAQLMSGVEDTPLTEESDAAPEVKKKEISFSPLKAEKNPNKKESKQKKENSFSEMEYDNLFASLKKSPVGKKRVAITIDANIADFVEQKNTEYGINNLSYVYNEILKKALEGIF